MKAFYAALIMLSQIVFSTIVFSTNAQGSDDKGMEKLCAAVAAGDLAGVNTALKQGASAKGFCDYGSAKAPLQVILMAPKNVDIIRALVKAGADINVEGYDGTILTKALKVDPKLGATPQDVEFVRFLISMGVNVNHKEPDFGSTALHDAAGRDLKLVQVLVEAGADVNAADDDGLTPLGHIRIDNVRVDLKRHAAPSFGVCNFMRSIYYVLVNSLVGRPEVGAGRVGIYVTQRHMRGCEIPYCHTGRRCSSRS